LHRHRRFGALDASLLLGGARLGLAPEPLDLAPQEVLAVLLDARGVSQALGFLLEVCSVAALVGVDLAVGDLERPLRHAIEQIAIVSDQQQRTLVLVEQVVLEPLDRLGVEVVGRLIEDGEVRARDEDPRQSHAAPLAAAELGEPRLGAGDAQMAEHGVHAVGLIPTAQALELLGDSGLFGQQRGRVLGLSRELPGHLLVPAARVVPGGQALSRRLVGAGVAVEARYLLEVLYAGAAAARHRSAVRRLYASENARQRALARSVPAHHADALPRVDRDLGRAQDDVLPVGLVQAARRNDRHAWRRLAPR